MNYTSINDAIIRKEVQKMPKTGDNIVYFWFPLQEQLPIDCGPYHLEFDPSIWNNGNLRPSQPGLPPATHDISLLLRDAKTVSDNGMLAANESAMKFYGLLRESSVIMLLRQWVGSLAWKIFRNNALQLKSQITIIEAAVTLPPGISSSSEDFPDHLTSALDSALNLARELVLTASAESHEPRVLPALELLPPLIPYVIVAKTGEQELQVHDGSFGMFANNAHVAWGDESDLIEAPEPQTAPLVLGLPNIYSSYQALRNDAELALIHHGEYRGAIVLSAAAAESLLTTLMESLLLEDGVDVSEARKLLSSRGGMLSKIQRVLGPRLGGQWDARRGSSVGLWDRHLVKPRNAVLHRGAHVTRTEAQEACAALHDLRRWVGGRVFANRRKYPKTSLAMAIGIMMTPEGTEADQGGWVLRRLEEADKGFFDFLRLLPGWAVAE